MSLYNGIVYLKDFSDFFFIFNCRTQPKDNGGTPIKHFVVELCDITTNNLWTSVAMTEDGQSCEQTIQHLREGHKYSFRVAAANRIGESEPADLINDVITKDPWGKHNHINQVFGRIKKIFKKPFCIFF